MHLPWGYFSSELKFCMASGWNGVGCTSVKISRRPRSAPFVALAQCSKVWPRYVLLGVMRDAGRQRHRDRFNRLHTRLHRPLDEPDRHPAQPGQLVGG